MTLWPELMKSLSSVIGALIGGSFVAWTGGYYSDKGKRRLLLEEWPRLLVEAQRMEYVKEVGKRLATRDDIENVLDQVRAVTRETEIVKAEISGGLWQRQWQETQKKDACIRLIDALENLQLKRSKIRHTTDDVIRSEAQRALRDAVEEFRRARVIARLLLPSEVIKAIGGLLRSISDIDPASCSDDQYRTSKKLISASRDRFVEMARKELGIPDSREPE